MKKCTYCISLILVLFMLYASSVSAQELTILGTTTDVNGKFRLSLVGMSRATLVVSFIGYRTVEVAVTSSTPDLGISLDEDILKLSAVVVTGLATSVAKRNVANSVAVVTSDQLVPTPTQTLDGALSGKFAGITVSQNSGAPGGGIDVKLRGISTINGANQPLYLVDGVIVNNAEIQSGVNAVTLASAAGSRFPQDQPVNRIADVNANDIETIEVLKGASAAAVYGSKAANGV